MRLAVGLLFRPTSAGDEQQFGVGPDSLRVRFRFADTNGRCALATVRKLFADEFCFALGLGCGSVCPCPFSGLKSLGIFFFGRDRIQTVYPLGTLSAGCQYFWRSR